MESDMNELHECMKNIPLGKVNEEEEDDKEIGAKHEDEIDPEDEEGGPEEKKTVAGTYRVVILLEDDEVKEYTVEAVSVGVVLQREFQSLPVGVKKVTVELVESEDDDQLNPTPEELDKADEN
jgi:hypothetical protein